MEFAAFPAKIVPPHSPRPCSAHFLPPSVPVVAPSLFSRSPLLSPLSLSLPPPPPAGDDAEQSWPQCVGALQILLQQAIIHLSCVFARLSIHVGKHLGRRPDPALAGARCSPLHAAASTPAAGAEPAHEELSWGPRSAVDAGRDDGSVRSFWARASASSAGIASVLLLFLHGLSVADVKHCGLVGFAVVLCAAHGRRSVRTWRLAVMYVGLVIVLDYLWHFDAWLPPLPLLGLGTASREPLWAWDVLGAEMVEFFLLALHMMRLESMREQRVDAASPAASVRGAADSLLEADRRRIRQRDAVGHAGPAVVGGEHGAPVAGAEEVKVAGWHLALQVWLRGLHRAAKGVGALWDLTGFLFVYVVMLVHGLSLTQMGTWALDGGKLRPAVTRHTPLHTTHHVVLCRPENVQRARLGVRG